MTVRPLHGQVLLLAKASNRGPGCDVSRAVAPLETAVTIPPQLTFEGAHPELAGLTHNDRAQLQEPAREARR